MKQKKHQSRIVLKEDQVLFGGLSLHYRFSVRSEAGEPRFSIEVCLGEEEASSEVGNHLVRALEIYRRIVGGAVTPCSLDDVLSDITVA